MRDRIPAFILGLSVVLLLLCFLLVSSPGNTWPFTIAPALVALIAIALGNRGIKIGAGIVISIAVALGSLDCMSGLRFRRATVVITSQPSEDVSVWLDGREVGTRTPLTFSDLELGEHEVTVRAPGFEEKTYRFNATGNTPLVVTVELTAAEDGTKSDPSLE